MFGALAHPSQGERVGQAGDPVRKVARPRGQGDGSEARAGCRRAAKRPERGLG
jgi:hypothetical protein